MFTIVFIVWTNYNTATHTYTDASASNTELYGIYAFGTESDYLDDVINYVLDKNKVIEVDGSSNPNLVNTESSTNVVSYKNEYERQILERDEDNRTEFCFSRTPSETPARHCFPSPQRRYAYRSQDDD